MTKSPIVIAMVALSLPLSAFSLGMGEMFVNSSLNEPFDAQIKLIDVNNSPLRAIKVRLAPYEDFQRIGLERNQTLDALRFSIIKDQQGQPVISIKSLDSIVEPYLQIIVDLDWSDGQIYKIYTVLLEQPDYHQRFGIQPKVVQGKNAEILNKSKVDSLEVMNRMRQPSKERKELPYGPTGTNENIWQIAQRFTASDTSIQQVILAIVGTNSQAFTLGNLNGLKSGEYLLIPSSGEIKKVPVELAENEVDAQTESWRKHQEIKHVLLPPYIDGIKGETQFKAADHPLQTPIEVSTIPQVPVFNKQSPSLVRASLAALFVQTDTIPTAAEHSGQAYNNDNALSQSTLKPDMPAQDERPFVRDIMGTVNRLHLQLKGRIRTLEQANTMLLQRLSEQEKDIQQLREQVRQLLKQQAMQTVSLQKRDDNELSLWLPLLLLLGFTTASGLACWYFMRLKRKDSKPELSKPVIIADQGVPMGAQAVVSLVRFRDEKESCSKLKGVKPPVLIKSKTALDTLLTLAKTYISMDEHETARQSLEEVFCFGEKDQQVEAQKLLKQIDEKKQLKLFCTPA